jgi:hypothetical protein
MTMPWCSAPVGNDDVVVLHFRSAMTRFEAGVAVSRPRAPDGGQIICPYFKCSELREITCQLFAIEKIADVVGDAAVFVGGDDLDFYGTGLLRDGGGVALIGFVVDGDPEEGELARDLFADEGGVLADASGEDEAVDAAEDCGVAGDGFGYGAAEDGNGLMCCGGAVICGGGELAEIGNPAKPDSWLRTDSNSFVFR